MSGHSKFHNIAEKKGKTDAARAKAFTQLARLITIAVKKGGADPSFNFALRTAIDKAKEGNVPKDNIERAIKKGTGELAGEEISQNRYEGYGPGGVAMMVDTLTDNPNRTVAELKHAFSKHGGNLSGSVAWQFEPKGVILVKGAGDKAGNDDWVLQGLDHGLEEAQGSEGDLFVQTDAQKLGDARAWLEAQGLKIERAELQMMAKERIPVADEAKAALEKLLEVVEGMDDVEKIWHNADL